MATLPTTVRSRLEELFEEHRDPASARSMRAYMRDQFEYYGIGAPGMKVISRTALEGLPAPTEAELAKIARTCWMRNEREWQYFACGYLRKHIRVASPAFIDVAHDLVVTNSWWDTVDSLALHTVGALVQRNAALVTTMDDWIDSENIWLARTAILHQLYYKTSTDADRLFEYCFRRSEETEFFIRKAIGWALREYSKTDERAVRTFVKRHDAKLSGLSKREALKWLEREGRKPSRSKSAKSSV